MNKLGYIIAAIGLAAAVCSCGEKMPEGADMSTLRVALSPEPGTFANGGGVAACAVTVHEGANLNVGWEVSVDANPSWIDVQAISYDASFTGTYDGDDRDYSVPGVRISVDENNTGAKRTAFLRFTVADGGSITYTITQAK